MKIGILTFWDSNDNYGQLLQCYASQCYLRSLSHDAFLIRYKFVSEHKPDRSTLTIIKKLLSPSKCTRKILDVFTYKKKAFINKFVLNHNENRGFDDFRRDYIVSTNKIYYGRDLVSSPPECDLQICGSDQIWASIPIDPNYFLQFGKKSQKRMALSASFGRTDYPIETIQELKQYLDTFDFITVRENAALNICKLAGHPEAELICDPTMLNDAEKYESIIEEPSTTNKVFIYYLGHPTKLSHKTIIKKLKNKAFVFCASQGLVDGIPKVFPSIPQWLGYIKSSSFVITNSFHGTVFCLLFKKQFAVIPLKNSEANDRIETLLTGIGLSSRICENEDALTMAMENSIDYGIVQPKIDMIKQRSRKQIDSILKEIANNL